MNDIYEYKARKYKHKYLKLKREYIGGIPNLFGPKVTKNKHELLDSKGQIYHNKDPTIEQVNFKKLLILLKKNITEKIEPLYNKQQILGNINSSIKKKNKIKFNINKKLLIDINKFDTINNIDDVNKIYDEIINRNKDYIPNILKCFFNIYLEKHVKHEEFIINKKDLFKSFSDCELNVYSTNALFTSKKNFDLHIENNKMNDIYITFIKQFVKNIDYYALTKVICDLYDNYNKYNYTVENKVGDFNLHELFTNFRNNFDSYLNNKILDNKYFIEQLDEIISVIK